VVEDDVVGFGPLDGARRPLLGAEYSNATDALRRHERQKHPLTVLVGGPIQALHATLSKQRFLKAARSDAAAFEAGFVVKQFR
jgi:hypothetical protein